MYSSPPEGRRISRSPSLSSLLFWKDDYQGPLPPGYPQIQRVEDDESRDMERQITLDKLEGRITPAPADDSADLEFHRYRMPSYRSFTSHRLTTIPEEDEGEIQKGDDEAIGGGAGSPPNPTVTGIDGYEDENAELDAATAADDTTENDVAMAPERCSTAFRDIPEITHPAFSFGCDDTWDAGSRISDDSCFDGHERVRPAEIEKLRSPAPEFATELGHDASLPIFLVNPGSGGATQVTRQNDNLGKASPALSFRHSQEPAPSNALVINDLRNSAQIEVSEGSSGTPEEILSPGDGVSIRGQTPGKIARVVKAVKSLFTSRKKTFDNIAAETIRAAPRGFRAFKGNKCMPGSPNGTTSQGGAAGDEPIGGSVAKTRLTVEELSRVKSQCGVIENTNCSGDINAEIASEEPLLDEQAMLPSPYGGVASGTARASASSAFDSFDPSELRAIARILRETSGDHGPPPVARLRPSPA